MNTRQKVSNQRNDKASQQVKDESDNAVITFHYYKSCKQRGIEAVIVCSLFFMMLGSAWFYLVFIQDKTTGIVFGQLLGWVTILLMPIFYTWSFMLLANSGEWNIKITNSEVMWSAPNKIGEQSFRVPIREITKFETQTSKFTDGSDSHCLVLANGNRLVIKPSQSGVNIDLFKHQLKSQGIDIEIK